MTQAKRPPESPRNREPNSELRERVRERMRQMAPLALVAAIPLTNAACDPAPSPQPYPLPTPTCERSPSSWAQFMRVDAVWGSEAGERIVLLTVSNPTDKPWLLAPSSYTVTGGMRLPSTALEPNVLRIKPDPGATVIQLQGTMTCHTLSAPMAITIDLLASGNPTVAIDAG